MSYTPGPWTIERQLVATIEGTTEPVHFYNIEVPAVCGGGIALVSMAGRGKENARLIANAPELLEALEAAVPYLIRLGDFIGNGEGATPMGRCEVIGRAKAAIANATKGE